MKVKTNTSIFVAALVFLLASCENFMTGANIAEDIKDSIKYANASSHTVFVNAEEGRGTFIQGGGSQTLKKGDSFNIEFSVSSAYRFIRWTAVDRLNNSIPRNSFISFSSDSDTSTSVTLLENQDDILILPYCLPYLTVDSFSPEYRENGVPYNSDIKITFSNYIELNAFSYTDDEIKKLNLTENDELLTENAFDGKSYTYGYKKGSNTKYKNLNISITKTGQNILSYFDAPVIINGKTLLLSLKKDFSSVLLSAIDSSIIEITLSLDEDVFDIHDSGFAENYSNLTFTYAVNTNIISDTPSVDMTFLCDEGTGLLSLQGINNIYTELTYPLNFEPASSWYFMEWGVFYALNQTEVADADKIVVIQDTTKKNTSFTLTTAIPGILIKPVCAKRPEVLLTSPVSDGVAADSPVTVTFSTEMNISDFHWAYKELENNSLRKVLRDDDNQIYGYETPAGEHIWRNIQISSSTGENLLSYFTRPDFTQNNTKLVIETDSNKTIPSGTIVMVKINKSIGDVNGIPCGNDDEYIEFNYLVN